jgi:phosphoesterase RecJ-like protein
MEKKFIQAYEKIKRANNVLLITHVRPDEDAVASVCAMAELLEIENKNFQIYCHSEPPEQYDFLAHVEKFSNDRSALNWNIIDLIIVLDCGQVERTMLADEILNRNKEQYLIEFDHHPRIEEYANLEIRDPEAAATTEILFHFFKVNRVRFNKNIANCILTGLTADTSFFLFPNTTEKTIGIASEMLKYGARFPQIIEYTWRNKSLNAMKIWGKAINNLKINPKYNLAFSVLTEEDINDSNITKEELEGIAGFLSNIYGVKGLMLLRQESKNIVRGSLRTNYPGYDISHLARTLGGGGHAKASGFVLKGKLGKTEKGWKVI